MLGMSGGMEWAVIAVIVILLFGGKKIPELAKGIGRGIKDFKKAVKDDEPAETASTDEAKKVEKTESTEESTTPSETTKQA